MLNPRFRKPYVDEAYSKYEQGEIDTQTLLDYLIHLNPTKKMIFIGQANYSFANSHVSRKKYNSIENEISEYFTKLRADGVENTF